jgi:2-polyprenyl-6-methoxyphenol hydroxylase-like FAD-dependent oxidoreductase
VVRCPLRSRRTEPPAADLLIVGAGPTASCALQLARRGLRPLIIDRNAGPARETRALGVQPARSRSTPPRLADRAIELGARATSANMWVRGRRRARVRCGDIGRDLSPYPFLLILGQDDNERLLGEALRATALTCSGTPSSSGWRSATSTSSRRSSAAGRAAAPSAPKSWASPGWPAATARAARVRGALGIDFVGAPYEHVFFVADTAVTGRWWRASSTSSCGPTASTSSSRCAAPTTGGSSASAAGAGRPRGRRLRRRAALAAHRHGDAAHLPRVLWFSTYASITGARRASASGRCFLLGDAAHIHSPVGRRA